MLSAKWRPFCLSKCINIFTLKSPYLCVISVLPYASPDYNWGNFFTLYLILGILAQTWYLKSSKKNIYDYYHLKMNKVR